MFDTEFWRKRDHVLGVGVMAGTSFDGIDIAIVDFFNNRFKLLYFSTFEYSKPLFSVLQEVRDNPIVHLEKLTRCHWTLGDEIAKNIKAAIGKCRRKVDFIATHGQTIYHTPAHRPGEILPMGGTLQLGEAAVIAEKTGILTLSDFRHADIAAGGQGAPLVPFFDYRYFAHPQTTRVFINIGGIANFTIVPARGKPAAIVAYDSGPGNMVIDALCSRLFNKPFDEAGKIAAQGKVNRQLLGELLQEKYFQQPAPKSTGRELFGVQYAEKMLGIAREREISPDDLLATITSFTAHSIAMAIDREPGDKNEAEFYISGGGWHNKTLIQMLSAKIKSQKIFEFAKLGIPGDAKEAVAFAALGYETLIGQPSNVPAATGASRPVMLGKISWPGNKSSFRRN